MIDMKNANYSQSFVDVDLKGNSFDLRIVRTYNSRSLHEGYFGFGWCSNIETRLKISGKTLLVQECGAGQQTEYVLDVSGGGQKILSLFQVLTLSSRKKEFLQKNTLMERFKNLIKKVN